MAWDPTTFRGWNLHHSTRIIIVTVTLTVSDRLEMFDASKDLAVLEYEGVRLPIFTELLTPFTARLNSLYVVIGEMQKRASVRNLLVMNVIITVVMGLGRVESFAFGLELRGRATASISNCLFGLCKFDESMRALISQFILRSRLDRIQYIIIQSL